MRRQIIKEVYSAPLKKKFTLQSIRILANVSGDLAEPKGPRTVRSMNIQSEL